jgi:3-dehydroquinate synthase
MSDYAPIRNNTEKKLSLNLGDRSYNIMIGQNLMCKAGSLIKPLMTGHRVLIVTDSNVAPLYQAKLESSLSGAGLEHSTVILTAGEKTKNFVHLQTLTDKLFKNGVDRKTVLVALGGGVIGDLSGFCAAITMRGIQYIQIPTTLLSQVDSSVGGKTGINTSYGKNLIGAFHQPLLVLVDLDCLDSLPRRQLLAGYAEVAKYGLIKDFKFFLWLEENAASLLDGNKALQSHAIMKSCATKANIVAQDERESGVRALLNLGHTFAHALEAEVGYNGKLLHGEAVSIGMVMAFDLSHRLGYCQKADADRVRNHLDSAGLPTSLTGLADDTWAPERLVTHMSLDKKAEAGSIVFVLASAIGSSFIARDINPKELHAFLADALSAA